PSQPLDYRRAEKYILHVRVKAQDPMMDRLQPTLKGLAVKLNYAHSALLDGDVDGAKEAASIHVSPDDMRSPALIVSGPWKDNAPEPEAHRTNGPSGGRHGQETGSFGGEDVRGPCPPELESLRQKRFWMAFNDTHRLAILLNLLENAVPQT